ncbi:MAG: hypothetical protein EAY69_07795 [Cytophagales bacterium]|nr:MAG: hypothetical protein EAY69_07795 [Cytophagales bacterium]
MFNTKISFFLVAIVLACSTTRLMAQATPPTVVLGSNGTNPIVTSVPFLNITPEVLMVQILLLPLFHF